jgi:hypothetical protein
VTMIYCSYDFAVVGIQQEYDCVCGVLLIENVEFADGGVC